MVNSIYNVVLRAAFTYVYVLVLARIMGRKLISQMSFSDFIVAITLGSLSANLGMGKDKSSTSAGIVLAVLTAFVAFTNFIHIRSFKARRIVDATPITIIKNGNIDRDNMRKTHLTLNELMMLLREKNIFNHADVELAVFETDGQLSVLPKPEKRPLTPSDMNINVQSTGIVADIIVDGIVLKDNLKSMNLDESWLTEQLKVYQLNDSKQVFYAGVDSNLKMYISKKQ